MQHWFQQSNQFQLLSYNYNLYDWELGFFLVHLN
jgi:hypothetical protein